MTGLLATSSTVHGEVDPTAQDDYVSAWQIRDGHVRVYLDRRYTIIACHLQTGRRTTIGPSSVLPAVSSRVASGVTRVRLAGLFVASVYVDVREGGRLAQLSVQDTRTSRQTRYAIAGGGVGSYGDITDLELTPGGAVVFIDGTQPQPFGISPSALTVRSYDRRGLTVLDDSKQAHAHSLSLDASRLSGAHYRGR